MKRAIVGAVAAVSVMQITATPAQAAPKSDPVRALQAHLARGQAVNVQTTAKVVFTPAMVTSYELDGTFGLGPRGAVASDVAGTLRFSKDMLRGMKKRQPADTEALLEGPIRMISSPEATYVSGPMVERAMPMGPAWVRYSRTALPQSNAVLDVLEPATLKTLMAHRTSWSGGVVKGSVRTRELAAASRSFRSEFGPGSGTGRGKVTYTLWLDPAGLVRRVSATAVMPYGGGSFTIESSSRYSDWGRELTVPLPLESDVIDRRDVEGVLPARLPGIWS
ncbi:hypothetical protein [Nonomuraea pusilla]|uniref:Uncharacterized protein n=1 Tax=Nonomuraea pusilla TaxID=46177 RepID=A0A1H7IIZ0_9ACTN|nr:hypothetical protein [Nonomuraea pusilla]SEK62471.1 hypothetical protein SAMN05660976_00824 [Nonomuraea pusilla]